MPRETVTPFNNLTGIEPYEVQVGWAQDQDVQVGITTLEGRSLFWQLFDPTKMGEVVRKIAEHGTVNKTDEEVGTALLNSLDSNTMSYSGLWVTLSRTDINRLIRLLRKARDVAYGRDE